MVKIIECPRDAIQGIERFIPTKEKIKYYQELLNLGFDILDLGSFVSPHAVPQMKDTLEVINNLKTNDTKTELLVIVGNNYGATQASIVDKIKYIGYPFAISETFMKNNINSSIAKGIRTIVKIIETSKANKKEVVIYISMAFGNPYGDLWSIQLLGEWINILDKLGVKYIQLSDTTGEATIEDIYTIFSTFIPKYKSIEFGFHLHSAVDIEQKIDSAYKGGCRKFDTVVGGMGGCPLSGYEMVSNLKTTDLLNYLDKNKIKHKIKDLSNIVSKSSKFYGKK